MPDIIINKTDELDVRLSVTETKVDNIESDVSEQKVMLKDISMKVDGLKERFDKMNGALPHIQDSCTRIEGHMEGVTAISNEQETKIEKNSVHIKLMWALMLPVVIAITGALVKIFINN